MITGQRICIIGPSSSGKSTLAHFLAIKLESRCYHLDQMAHIPGTHWQRRPVDELIAAQDAILKTDKWIIEGNYSICMPQRLTRADTVIWLDMNVWGCVWRYLKRCLQNKAHRYGTLENASGEFSAYLIKYTLLNYPQNRKKYWELIQHHPHLNVMTIKSLKDLNEKFYSHNDQHF